MVVEHSPAGGKHAPDKGASEGATLPGLALLEALFSEARRRHQSLSDLAAALGISHSYLSQLKSGKRSIPNINDELSAACAAYLNVPRIYVLLMADKVHRDDFGPNSRPVPETPGQRRTRVLRMLCGMELTQRVGVTEEDLAALPPRVQDFLVLLHGELDRRKTRRRADDAVNTPVLSLPPLPPSVAEALAATDGHSEP